MAQRHQGIKERKMVLNKNSSAHARMVSAVHYTYARMVGAVHIVRTYLCTPVCRRMTWHRRNGV